MSEPVLNPDDRDALIRRYQARIAEHGATFESMKSGSPDKQRIRHQIHAAALQGSKPHILDVGCGLGQFYSYLKAAGIDCTYSGYDIVPEYISECKRLYPEADFSQRNIFEEGIQGEYDTIVMSQVLNNRYQHSDNLEVMRTALTMAFQHSRVSVSVDMMSSYVDFQNPDLYYYPPEQILVIARSIARRVVLRHDYRPFEFCIQLYHEDAAGFVP